METLEESHDQPRFKFDLTFSKEEFKLNKGKPLDLQLPQTAVFITFLQNYDPSAQRHHEGTMKVASLRMTVNAGAAPHSLGHRKFS